MQVVLLTSSEGGAHGLGAVQGLVRFSDELAQQVHEGDLSLTRYGAGAGRDAAANLGHTELTNHRRIQRYDEVAHPCPNRSAASASPRTVCIAVTPAS